MALLQTLYAVGTIPMPIPKGPEVVSARLVYDSTILANFAINDVIELGFLPADCVPVDWIIDNDDMDSSGSPAVVIDFGILNAGKTAVSTATADGGAKWLTGSTQLQAAGVLRATTVPTWRTLPSSSARSIGIVVTTASATFAEGKVAVTFKYRAARQGG